MKFSTIFTTLLTGAAVLSGCSKDDGGNAAIPAGEKAKMGITFTLPVEAGETRADQEASTDESNVRSISVYIFDANGIVVSQGGYTHFSDISGDFDRSGNTYTLKSSRAIETVSGSGMQVYVATNHPAPTSYATRNTLMDASAAVADLCVPATGFTMFSAVDRQDLTPYDEDDPASLVTVSLGVDRVVSKVTSSTATRDYTVTWSNGVGLKYSVLSFGVYQEAVRTYLVENSTTLSVLNSFPASKAKDNVDVVNGHPATGTARASMAGFYVGENVPQPTSLYGNTTYAMIGTTVTPTHAAKWNAATQTVGWSNATYSVGLGGVDDIYIVRTDDGATYITNVKADIEEIALETGFGYYTYPKGYVHFQVFLNKGTLPNRYRVERNEFIHVLVNGVKTIDGYFPGYPGDPGEPDKPIDPTDPTDPNNPDPVDPTDPTDPEDAALQVEVDINPWKYKENPVVLE